MEESIVLKGNLRYIDLPVLIDLLNEKQLTGILACQDDSNDYIIFDFQNGSLVYSKSISEEQVEKNLQYCSIFGCKFVFELREGFSYDVETLSDVGGILHRIIKAIKILNQMNIDKNTLIFISDDVDGISSVNLSKNDVHILFTILADSRHYMSFREIVQQNRDMHIADIVDIVTDKIRKGLMYTVNDNPIKGESVNHLLAGIKEMVPESEPIIKEYIHSNMKLAEFYRIRNEIENKLMIKLGSNNAKIIMDKIFSLWRK